jgi:aminomethyltransferase
VINAGTREKDFNWVRDKTRQFDCAVENLSDDFTQIAIQGPKAVRCIAKADGRGSVSAVKFYWVTRGNILLVEKSMALPEEYSYCAHRVYR